MPLNQDTIENFNFGDHLQQLFIEGEYTIPDDTSVNTVQSVPLISKSAGMTFKHDLALTELCPIKIPRTGTKTLAKVFQIIKDSPEDYPVDSLNLVPCEYTLHNIVQDEYPVSEGYNYCTFLRDPVSRVWSHWHLWKLLCMDRITRVPFRAWLPPFYFENLSGHFLDYRDLACQHISGRFRQPVTPETFELAKANLDKFFFVGIFEDYIPSVKELLKKMGITTYNDELRVLLETTPEPSRSWGTSPIGWTAPNEEEAEIIREYNEYDIRLYEYAVQKMGNN